jgi:DNA replication and repair protein RecF
MNPFFVYRIFAHQFRNLESFQVTPHPRLNILFGHNGQGKTNIIEAISVCLSTKALRPVKQVTDLITHGYDEGRLEVQSVGDGSFESTTQLSAKGKKYEIGGKFLKDFSSLLERVAVVSFVPEELQIVSASSSFRRRAMNQIAAGFFPTYVGLYRKYEKALFSRNQLLKNVYCDLDELGSFNHVYAELAAQITSYRDEAVRLWLPYFLASIKDIVGDRYAVNATYVPSSSSNSADILEQLKSLYPEERMRRSTLSGPHLDDLSFTIDGAETRFLASRGQARAIVLAIKLGQLNAIAQLRQTPTILLLDDVAGELDPEKVNHLMATVGRLHIQTFLTTTHLEGLFDFTKDCSTFEIEAGRIKPCKDPVLQLGGLVG